MAKLSLWRRVLRILKRTMRCLRIPMRLPSSSPFNKQSNRPRRSQYSETRLSTAPRWLVHHPLSSVQSLKPILITLQPTPAPTLALRPPTVLRPFPASQPPSSISSSSSSNRLSLTQISQQLGPPVSSREEVADWCHPG